MKVVKQISTGNIVYRQSPDFEPGKGIECARAMHGLPITDLEEVEITQAEWNAEIAQRVEKEKETQLDTAITKALAQATLNRLNVLGQKVGLATIPLASWRAEIKSYL